MRALILTLLFLAAHAAAAMEHGYEIRLLTPKPCPEECAASGERVRRMADALREANPGIPILLSEQTENAVPQEGVAAPGAGVRLVLHVWRDGTIFLDRELHRGRPLPEADDVDSVLDEIVLFSRRPSGPGGQPDMPLEHPNPQLMYLDPRTLPPDRIEVFILFDSALTPECPEPLLRVFFDLFQEYRERVEKQTLVIAQLDAAEPVNDQVRENALIRPGDAVIISVRGGEYTECAVVCLDGFADPLLFHDAVFTTLEHAFGRPGLSE